MVFDDDSEYFDQLFILDLIDVEDEMYEVFESSLLSSDEDDEDDVDNEDDEDDEDGEDDEDDEDEEVDNVCLENISNKQKCDENTVPMQQILKTDDGPPVTMDGPIVKIVKKEVPHLVVKNNPEKSNNISLKRKHDLDKVKFDKKLRLLTESIEHQKVKFDQKLRLLKQSADHQKAIYKLKMELLQVKMERTKHELDYVEKTCEFARKRERKS